MARLRFGDQSVPRVTRVATGGGGGTIGSLADVDLTDTSSGGLQEGGLLVYDSTNARFIPTTILNNITINGVALMASEILIKRSTGTAAPGTINYGELAITVGTGSQLTSVIVCSSVITMLLPKSSVVSISPICWIKSTVY